MTASRGLDLALALLSALAWSFAGYLLGSRLASEAAGVLLALGLFAGAVALMAGRRDRALDLVMNLLGALAWGFAAFVIGSRLFSTTAGGVLGLGVLLSALATVLNAHLQETRMQRLSSGACPRCGAAVASEHHHRRWDATGARWLPPATSWRCAACGYEHGEQWPCPACPEAA